MCTSVRVIAKTEPFDNSYEQMETKEFTVNSLESKSTDHAKH